MTESHPPSGPDEVMTRLQAADPLAGQPLPHPDEPEARAMVASAMAAGEASALEPGAEVIHAQLPAVNRRARSTTAGRWPLLAGVAAVVALVVSGLMVFSPTNSSALAAVHQAAEATAEAGSGQIDVRFALHGQERSEAAPVELSVSGSLTALYHGTDLAVTVDLDELPDELTSGGVPTSVEARLVDDTLYANDGTQWYWVNAPSTLGATVVELIDPRQVLGTVQELAATEEQGRVELNGIDTTHYRSMVDLSDQSLTEAKWLPVGVAHIEAEGKVIIDLYVDDQGLLRRLVLSGSAQPASRDHVGDATFEVEIDLSRLGDDLTIEAPEGATPVDEAGGFPFGS